MKGIGKGWHYKYPEHALAAKGIRTKIRYPKVKGSKKIKKVMREFKEHKLHSGRDGLVTSRPQAVAIALSEQRKAEKKMRNIPFPKESFKHLIAKQKHEAFKELEHERKEHSLWEEKDFSRVRQAHDEFLLKTGEQEKGEVAKEKKEHPWATEKQAERIVKDHEKALLKEKKDIVKHYDEFTTSDLQGVVEALAKKYNVDDDKLLEEIIIAHNYKTSTLQNEYLERKRTPNKFYVYEKTSDGLILKAAQNTLRSAKKYKTNPNWFISTKPLKDKFGFIGDPLD
jgi:hypothetical protein